MKLTKYEHSCVVLEKEGQSLVIDPGELSTSFNTPENCVGVVVTHEHFDHLDQEKLRAVLVKNPDAKIYTNSGVFDRLEEDLKKVTLTITSGQAQSMGDFELEFVGELHEKVRPEVVPCQNVGVIVDGLFYVPGDSHFVPERVVAWLGAPLNAPWSKVSETNEFIKAVKAQHVLPIHDGLLTEAGVSTYESHVIAACEAAGSVYHPITVGEQIEL